MLEVGKVVTLDNNDYVVINTILLHNVRYVFLTSIQKPYKLIIASESKKEDNIELIEVKDNNELDYVLSQFVLDNGN